MKKFILAIGIALLFSFNSYGQDTGMFKLIGKTEAEPPRSFSLVGGVTEVVKNVFTSPTQTTNSFGQKLWHHPSVGYYYSDTGQLQVQQVAPVQQLQLSNGYANCGPTG
jgi:hypothetical protein